MGVSAYVYQQYTQSISQKIIDVVSFTLNNCDLGPLKEGETRIYDDTQIESLKDAIKIQVDDFVSHVDLDIYSNLDQIDELYTTYDIIIKFSDVVGETYTTGDNACTISIRNKDYSSIELDAPGNWSFDFEILTSAKSIDEDTPSSVILNVSAHEH